VDRTSTNGTTATSSTSITTRGASPPLWSTVGLFDRTQAGALSAPGRHVGALVLSVPVRESVLTGVLPDLEPYRESAELGRLVLLDAVPANGETARSCPGN